MGELTAQSWPLEGFKTDGIYQVFATAVGSIAAITALVYMVVIFLAQEFAICLLFGWDIILFILWVSVFGVFGEMYIKATSTFDGGIKRMKAAVWVDCINMILWLVSAIGGAYVFFKERKNGGMRLHSKLGKV